VPDANVGIILSGSGSKREAILYTPQENFAKGG
jgi:hypothetical protein